MRDRLRALIASLRERAGGARAILLAGDRRVLAVDGPIDPEPWHQLLEEIDERWERWCDWQRFEAFIAKTGATALVYPVGDGAFAITEIANGTIGLARLRAKSVIAELDEALRR